jgi:hypothetical protein
MNLGGGVGNTAESTKDLGVGGSQW